MIDITNKTEVYNYVISSIDDAISNQWIKVYYQPVVRSLTGQLCGAESLARWIDPNIGFLSPDKFIGALEEHELIHKLDCFMVEKVCSDIHEHLESGRPTFPVSINFSRLDFIKCDMLELVEKTVGKYNIPRDYLHIEITESMIAKDEDLMTKVIESFRKRGYEIWMDDFGSGYSSLTLLQDYQFDLLKMDMRFLSTMTEKSKIILNSTINMAKHIGVKTLSEGVETREQIEFLTSIGCGKLQGYYYGKPQPYDDMLSGIEEKGITIEERQWRSYYETACLSMVDLDRPLEIIEYDGTSLHTLFMNESFKQQISIREDDLSLIDKILYNPSSPMMAKYHQFIETAIKSKAKESFYYTLKGNYYLLKGEYLAEHAGRYLFKASITNISVDQNTTERNTLDLRLRELNNLYEMVLFVNPKENIIYPLLGGYSYSDGVPIHEKGLVEVCKAFAEKYIFPTERKSFLDFTHQASVVPEELKTGPGFIKHPYRTRQADGSYKWREYSILSIAGSKGREFLFTVNLISDDLARALDKVNYKSMQVDDEKVNKEAFDRARLWETLIQNSSQKLFWKDKNRRFLGVSQSFLDFYEIRSLDDIIGKNDEEMHWHVDDGPYKGDELDVLSSGKVVFNAPGQCIVNGVVHNIICNKMPIYDKGEIVGLVGSFADADQELYRVQKLISPSKLDTATRLMNNKFFMSTMIDYAMQFNENGKDYGLILLHSTNHHRIEETFGAKFASKVLREIGEKIIDVIGQRAVAGRPKEAYFGVIIYVDSKDKLKELELQLKEHIEEINSVGGNSVTIRMASASVLRTEEGVTDESMYQMALEQLNGK